MGMHVALVEAHNFIRAGLKAILASDHNISQVSEATTNEELENLLKQDTPNFIVIHQCFITDISILPHKNITVLADKPDKNVLLDVFSHGACAYLSEKPAPELLLKSLHNEIGDFILDPSFTAWILRCTSRDTIPAFDESVLTIREREIFDLLRQGLTYRSIANQLSISITTVKTHIARIFRKLDIKRRPGTSLSANS